MKSPALQLFHHIVDFLTAFAAVHLGLLAMGYNVFGVQFLMNLERPFGYIFGIAGIISLIFMVGMHGMYCDCRGCPTCNR